jgi:hypothetical protein
MSKATRSPLRTVLFLLLAALPLVAATLPNAKPEEVGLSSERLQRIHQMLQRRIDAGDIAGAVTLVARNGRVAHFETHGLMDIETKKPMAKDAIFRLASMTKPVTGVAIMMLVEEGKVRLTDPVSKFIPEFKDMKVAVAKTPVHTHFGFGEWNHQHCGSREGLAQAQRDFGGLHSSAGIGTARIPTGFALDLQSRCGIRYARPRRRDCFRTDFRPVPETTHIRSTWHEGHVLLTTGDHHVAGCFQLSKDRKGFGKTAGSRPYQIFLGLRRIEKHRGRLFAIRANVSEWRPAEWETVAKSADR